MDRMNTQAHTHTRLTVLCPGLPVWAGTRKVKPIWILLKQETVSGSGISWTICKTAPHSRQITTPAPHHSVFYRPDALPAAQPTASKHWRHNFIHIIHSIKCYGDLMYRHTSDQFVQSTAGRLRALSILRGKLARKSTRIYRKQN